LSDQTSVVAFIKPLQLLLAFPIQFQSMDKYYWS